MKLKHIKMVKSKTTWSFTFILSSGKKGFRLSRKSGAQSTLYIVICDIYIEFLWTYRCHKNLWLCNDYNFVDQRIIFINLIFVEYYYTNSVPETKFDLFLCFPNHLYISFPFPNHLLPVIFILYFPNHLLPVKLAKILSIWSICNV